MNLREWADQQGVHPQTAYRWFRTGTLPVQARKRGKLILVGDLEIKPEQRNITAVYARVSSADQRADLDRQVARVSAWAIGTGLSVDRIVTEVGSGLNGKRRRFLSLLNDQAVTTIVVEHRDRSPGSARSTLPPRLRRVADDWSWSTMPRWTPTWCGT